MLKDSIIKIKRAYNAYIFSNELWGAGNSANGNLDSEIAQRRFSLIESTGVISVFDIGTDNILYIKTDGTLWGVGGGTQGKLGNNSTATLTEFAQIGNSSDWSDISAGYSHTMAIKTNGSLWGWGFNTSGQVGDLSVINRSSPVQIGTLTNWETITVGNLHAMSIKTDGTLWGWGANDLGQLGNSESLYGFTSVANNKSEWSKVATGFSYTMAIKTDGTLWGWGVNSSGQLGDNTTTIRSSPIQIGTLSNWSKIYANQATTISIKTDGTLWGWGANTAGQLGDLTTVNKSSPLQIGTLNNWLYAGAGNSYTIAVKNDGTLWAWGLNTVGQLGDGESLYSLVEIKDPSTNWYKVSVGGGHSLAIKTDGTLWGWGVNSSGQIGNNSTSTILSPIQIGTLNTWSKVFGSDISSFVISTNGSLWAWGNNSFAELGDRTTINRSSPVQIGTLNDWSKIYSGFSYTMAIKTDGTLWGWGRNSPYGRIGDITTVNKSSPVQIGTLNNWSNVANGINGTLAVKTDGTLWAWGYNDPPIFGNNASGTLVSSPIQIGTLSNWSKVTLAQSFAMAIKTDGTLWGWGLNTSGELGAYQFYRNVIDDVSEYSSGSSNTMVIKTNGTLWAWGSNLGTFYALGDGTTVNRSSPVQIGTFTDWSKISTSSSNGMAIKNNGTLWGWGYNAAYHLGDNTTTNRISPVQIGTFTDWSKVSVGQSGVSMGIKTDGTLWGWGTSYYGELGLGQAFSQARSPVQIGTLSDWSKVYTSDYATMAVKTDGTLWGWGYNASGRLGDDTTVDKSSPVQIGTLSDWSDVLLTSSAYMTVALKTDNSLWTWGSGFNYLGDGTNISRSSPVQIGDGYTSIASNNVRTFYLTKTDGTIWGWGLNSTSQLMNNSDVAYSIPIQLDSRTNWLSIKGGDGFSTALDTSNRLYTFGNNSSVGQLGDFGLYSNITRSSPIQIGKDTNWSDISAGATYTIALKTDKTLWAWGQGGYLGNGADTTRYSSPIQITNRNDWEIISAKNLRYAALAKIDSNRDIYVMGAAGQAGSGWESNKSSPIQVGTLTNWADVETGISNSFSIKTDGTLWAWGSNIGGSLGTPLLVNSNYDSPVQIGGLTDWSKISASGSHTLAIKADGTLWSWGTNSYGELGFNNVISRSSPTQIGSSNDWSKIAAGGTGGFFHSLSIKTDGTLWSWGANNVAQLGLLDLVSRSVPTQISYRNNWTEISAAKIGGHSAGISENYMYVTGNTQNSVVIGGVLSKSSPVQIGTLNTWSEVYTKHHTNLALKADGTLWAWGYNRSGTMGINNFIDVYNSPVQIGTQNNWFKITTSDTHSLALKNNGTLWAWGQNGGNLGMEYDFRTFNLGYYPFGWDEFAASRNYTMAIKTDGTLWAWGTPSNGELGDGFVNVTRSSPVQIGTLNNWSKIFVNKEQGSSEERTFSIKTDGTLWGWGVNTAGQLGFNNVISRSSPVQIGTLNDWSSVSLASRFTIALRDNGTLWSWGTGTYGELGANRSNNSSPVQIGTLNTWSKIAAGYYRGFAIKTDNTLWGWGGSFYGELGDNTIVTKSSPVQIGNEGNWLDVSSGLFHTIAVKTNGTLWAWGNIDDGQLGNDESAFQLKKITLSSSWAKVSGAKGQVNNSHTMAIKTDGTLWGWGSNAGGQLGDGTDTNRISPIQIGNLNDWSNISCGDRFSISIKTDGTLWAWGINNNGQLGDGTSITKTSPVQIGTLNNWSSVSSNSHTMAIKTDGTLWGWGVNGSAQIGNGSVSNVSSPVQIGTLSNWSAVSAGQNHSIAVKTDGTLWGWGTNNEGQLGDGTKITRFSPIQIGTLTNWSSNISASTSYSMAIKTDGTLWAWGLNNVGQYGDNTNVFRSSPIQIGNENTWSKIKSINSTNIAFKTDGTLWGWGNNSSGLIPEYSIITRSSPVQIGTLNTWIDGDITSVNLAIIDNSNEMYVSGLAGYNGVHVNKSSPIQIGTLTNWSKVYTALDTSFAFKTDNTLWAWGLNSNGIFGNSSNSDVYSSPVQIASHYTLNGKISVNSQTIAIQNSENELIFSGNETSSQRGGRWFDAFPYPRQIGKDNSWSDVSAGINYSLAEKTNGTLWGWGINSSGQLGDMNNTSAVRSSPVQIANINNLTDVKAGNANSIILKTDGKLYSTNLGMVYGKSSPIQVTNASNWNKFSVGSSHAMAIKTDGTLWAWGGNSGGQFGDNTTLSDFSPVQIGTLNNWSDISSGEFHNLALKTDGTLWSWGNDASGQLGQIIPINRSSPVQIGTLSTWSKISAGTNTSYAISSNGSLWAWGNNSSGQLGDITSASKSSPVQIGTLTDWSKISGGNSYAMAIKTNGTLWGWGVNSSGQLGDGTATGKSSPVQIGTLTDWSDVSAGISHTLAVKSNGTIWGWGGGAGGQLGLNFSTSAPNLVNTNNLYSKVTGGHYFSVALATNGTLWSWGNNSFFGKLGDRTTVDRSSPVQIGTLADWSSISSKYASTLVIKTNGTLWAWGNNSNGTLGDNTSVNKSSPVQIGTLTNWTSVSTGGYISGAIKSDGTLWLWGLNNSGQIGDGTSITRSSPVQIGTLNNWSKISVSALHVLAIKNDGSLWTWGTGQSGALGNMSTIGTSSPVQLGTLTDWSIISTGVYSSMAIKTNGTLWAWGENSRGQLGDGTVINRSSPVQIGTLSNWSKISCGDNDGNLSDPQHTLAIKTDGTLWGWGTNSSGQIGDGTNVSKSSPVQIGTRNDWSEISANRDNSIFIDNSGYLYSAGANTNNSNGYIIGLINRSSPVQIGRIGEWDMIVANKISANSYAIKTEGTLWSWGSNTSGSLGDGTIINRSSPVQIGNLNFWDDVVAGQNYFIAKLKY